MPGFVTSCENFTLVGKELDDQGDVPCEKALVFLDGRKQERLLPGGL